MHKPTTTLLACSVVAMALGQAPTPSDAETDRPVGHGVGSATIPETAATIWQNGYDSGEGLYTSQIAHVYPFEGQTADDFVLPTGPGGQTQWSIQGVRWAGGYWNGGTPPFTPRFNIMFYADRGDGNAPTGGPNDPTGTALHYEEFPFSDAHETYTGSPGGSPRHSYHVALATPFLANVNTRYWLAVQSGLEFPPQWGWATTNSVTLHVAVLHFPDFGIPFWRDWTTDVSYELIGAAEPPYAVGDLNCDGVIDNFDINPFVLALTVPSVYVQQYPNCYWRLADCNGDGYADNFDINPFVALLIGH